MEKIKCVINTISSEVTSKEGDMIVLPSEQGEVGILPRHTSMISELVAGKIKIYCNNEIIEEIEIKSGVAYIKSDQIEIFIS
jgi:F-type H+-transporting ATPase subunit epsilon